MNVKIRKPCKKFRMKYTQIFPTVLMALDALAATAYGFNGDWRRTV